MNVKEVITDSRIFFQSYILRDGFEFKSLTFPHNIYDAIVIKNPANMICQTPRIVKTERTLGEQIDLVNKLKLKKAYVVAEEISFITECPTLEHLSVIPAGNAKNHFDFSPLYSMPKIKSLNCKTQYGDRDQYSSFLDYTNVTGLESLSISGSGHNNYNQIATLKSLGISGYKGNDLTQLFHSPVLDTLLMIQCKIKSLHGIQQSNKMQCLYLYYNRALQDISALRHVKSTLKALRIENCPKIEDFSVLSELDNLELLELSGSNVLPSLDFLKTMKNLKTFVFSMNVLDGDLSPCMRLSYVFSEKDRKHYSHKDRELPKIEYVRGNEDIEEWRRLE